MLRFLDWANALTLVGLAFGVLAVVFAAEGRLALSVCALMAAGSCDTLDGPLARRMKRSDQAREFGARLDSLTDACAFGLAPITIFYAVGVTSPAEVAILIVYTSCAVWRLAYFDTVGLTERQDKRYYTGVPTTFIALVLPIVFLIGVWERSALRLAATCLALGYAVAMVLPIQVPKPGKRALIPMGLFEAGMASTYLYLAWNQRFTFP